MSQGSLKPNRVIVVMVMSALVVTGNIFPWGERSRSVFQMMGSASAQITSTTLTVNGSSTPITVPGGTTVTLRVQNAPGSPTDCVTLDFIDFAGFDGVNHQFFAWATGSTMTLSFAMPTVPGSYAARYWQGCGTQLAISPTVTWGPAPLSVPAPTPAPGPGIVKATTAYHEIGNTYVVTQDFGTAPDTMQGIASILKIFENGKELGPGHSVHADIRSSGLGRFSHWGSSDGWVGLYFSASDNSDPRTNGRMYTYSITQSAAPAPVPAPTPTPAPVVSPAPPPTPVPAPAPAPTSPPTTCSTACFYVSPAGNDGNPGTQDAPWRTITKAANTLMPGETAVVMDGTYEEPEIQFNRSGADGQPITIMAQNKWQAILSSTSGCNPNISLYASYIVIDGLRSQISPNDVLCPRHPNSADGAAVRLWPDGGGHHSVIRNMLVDDHSHRSLGIKSNQNDALIENNEVHNSLEVMTGANNIFRNNVTYGGDAWGSVFTSKGGTRNVQVYNNVFHMTNKSTEGGLILGGSSSCCMYEPTGYECYNCVAYNNVVINESASASLGLYGFRACKDCLIFNNVGIRGQWFTYQGGPASNNLTSNSGFKNNILVCGNGSATGGILGWNNFSNMTVDYNNFWQCSSGVPAQSHAIVGDPLFVDLSSDWHLQPGSPALGAGVEVTIFGFGGEVIDAWRDRDNIVRAAPRNLGIY